MIKIIMVDDDKLILKSLEIILKKEADFEIIATTSNGNEAVEICRKDTPDVMLMDIQMPIINGIETTKLIKKEFPNVLILMLTTFADKPHIKDAMAAGAQGYLLKTDPISEVPDKLRMLLGGTGIMSQDALRELTKPTVNAAIATLTPREKSIAELVARGKTNKEIAAELFLGEGTVRNNIVIIMEKMDVTNRTQLGLAYYGIE